MVAFLLGLCMKEFLDKLSHAYDAMDYYQFLEITGFVDSNYSLEKFKLFQQSARGLMSFDYETLAMILK